MMPLNVAHPDRRAPAFGTGRRRNYWAVARLYVDGRWRADPACPRSQKDRCARLPCGCWPLGGVVAARGFNILELQVDNWSVLAVNELPAQQ